jgi:hypothetical protein
MNTTARSISLALILCAAHFVSAQTNNTVGVTGHPPYDPVAAQKEYTERIHKMVLAERELNPFWYKTNKDILSRDAVKKLLIRPDAIDDAGWEYYQLMLEMVLEGNQPIEFYARVVDQDAKPVAGARLELHLSGVDTDKVLAKYPHMNMGDEQVFWTNVMTSDFNGWIRLKGIAGHYLNVWGYASKDGYSAKNPDGNFGTIIYETKNILETNCVKRIPEIRTSTKDLPVDAVDSSKGVVFQLQKTNVVPK